MTRISLLITTFNDPIKLKTVLSYHLKQSPQPFEILICDDGSKAETKALVDSFARTSRTPIIHVYQEDRGWDVAGIRNLGAIQSSGDYLLMTDGDCVPHPRFIHDHLAAAEKGYVAFGDRSHVLKEYTYRFSPRPDVLMHYLWRKKIHKRISAVRNPFERSRIYSKSHFPDIVPLACLVLGCNFGVWKNDLLAVNGFDESFRMWWPEDVECAARLLNRGLKIKKFRQKCLVYHLDHDEAPRNGDAEYLFANSSLISEKLETTKGVRERLSMPGHNGQGGPVL